MNSQPSFYNSQFTKLLPWKMLQVINFKKLQMQNSIENHTQKKAEKHRQKKQEKKSCFTNFTLWLEIKKEIALFHTSGSSQNWHVSHIWIESNRLVSHICFEVGSNSPRRKSCFTHLGGVKSEIKKLSCFTHLDWNRKERNCLVSHIWI